MEKLWDVAPAGTWAVLTAAAILLLAGFVLLSHGLVRGKAYGDEWSGLLRAGALEATIRLGAAAVSGGLALWAVELSAPVWVTLGLAAVAAAAAGVEAAARLRG